MAGSGSPFLVLRSTGDRQVLVSLAGRTRLTIGRRPECDVAVLGDGQVSRLHAELVLIGHDWIVTDDGLSTNGTWVGERRITGRYRLRDGDLVRVGNTPIAFCAPLETQVETSLVDDASAAVSISPAQRRVLVALCRPFLLTGSLTTPSNAAIAAELFLSIDSVKTHMKALIESFGLGGSVSRVKRTELVDRAVRSGSVLVRDVSLRD
jgi:pSer/pThr/pTyr-binding forkhead associated (FHA) protein